MYKETEEIIVSHVFAFIWALLIIVAGIAITGILTKCAELIGADNFRLILGTASFIVLWSSLARIFMTSTTITGMKK